MSGLGLPPEQPSDDGAEELVWGTSGLGAAFVSLGRPRGITLSRMQVPQQLRVSQGPDDAIRVIAAAVIRDGDRILVWHDHDPATGEVVAVPLAGGIEFGETGEQAIRRELKRKSVQDQRAFAIWASSRTSSSGRAESDTSFS